MTLYNTVAAHAVLAALMLEPVPVWAQMQQRSVAEAWFCPGLEQAIYRVCAAFCAEQKPFDSSVVLQCLLLGEDIGSEETAQFSQISTATFTTAFLSTHLEQLQQAYLRRTGLTAVASLQQELSDPAADPSEALAGFLGSASALLVKPEPRESVGQMVRAIARRVVDGTDDSRYVPTGIAPLDDRGMFKLNRGDYLIIKAKTSGGKSALASQLAVSYLLQGYRIAFYPLEMSSSEVIERMLSQMSGVSPEFVSQFTRRADNEYTLSKAAGFQKQLCDAGGRLILDGDKGLLHMRDDLFSWDAIRADICAEHAKQPFTFVVVDYAQLVRLHQQGNESRQQQLARMAVDARQLCKELQMIICMPSQLDDKSGGAREARDLDNAGVAALLIEQTDAGHPGKIKVEKQRRGQKYFYIEKIQWDGPNTRFISTL